MVAGLSTAWERRVSHTAAVFALLTLIVSVGFAVGLARVDFPLWVSLALSPLVAFLVYVVLTSRLRRRRKILARPFPAEWEAILQREVVFFRALDPDEQSRFRRELQVFLGEKRITGIKLKLDTTTRC